MQLSEFKECMENGSLIIFMSLDGIIVSSDDPLIGQENCSIVLKSETDFQTSRKYPKPGDRLDNYHVNRETGAWYTTPSHWVVWRVEVFNSADENQVMREVVIAWCKKETVTQS
ncbi:MAG: hypothetical protein HEQ35_00890 [Gloeotrichia echinulata IR180]|jgi:hypothetical protein|nr:hypothetical protein [Gloeotrichia echinulata DEX184]